MAQEHIVILFRSLYVVYAIHLHSLDGALILPSPCCSSDALALEQRDLRARGIDWEHSTTRAFLAC